MNILGRTGVETPSKARKLLASTAAAVLSFTGCAPAPSAPNKWNSGNVVSDGYGSFHAEGRWTCVNTGNTNYPRLALDDNVDYYRYSDGARKVVFYAEREYNNHELVPVFTLPNSTSAITKTGSGCNENTPRVF